MPEEKKTKTLREQIDALTFSTRQAGGKNVVKQNIGKRKKASTSSSLSSLNSLKSSLGTKFSSK